MITQSPGAVIPIENIPEELAERNQWVCWRYDERDGKLTKVPYTPDPGARRTLMRASSTDPATWATFSEAVDACGASEGYYGVGFVFSDDDPYVGIDIDNCRSPESSDIAEWAQKIIERVSEGYIEVSPSGTGVHIIVEGAVRDGGRSRKKVHVDGEVVGEVEMYSRGRYFTITGDLL